MGEWVGNSEFANLLFFVGDRALRSWERPPHRFADAKRHPSQGGEWTFLRVFGRGMNAKNLGLVIEIDEHF